MSTNSKLHEPLNRLRFYYKFRRQYRDILRTMLDQKCGFNEAVFSVIHAQNLWRGGASKSGKASGLAETERIARELRRIRDQYRLESLVDIPCGDCHWQFVHQLGFSSYVGADIVASLIERTKAQFSEPGVAFMHLDILKEVTPAADLILCRDLMIHLPNRHILTALKNLGLSNSRYVAISTSPGTEKNRDIPIGASRRVNLEAAPFNLPRPIEYLQDGLNAESNRVIGLWKCREMFEAL